MPNNQYTIIGLTNSEVAIARKKYGNNKLRYKRQNRLWIFLLSLIKEPMIVLLLVAVLIYAISGGIADSLFLAAAILLVATISWFQERRSQNALKALKKLSSPRCKVIREGRETTISSDELVVGDALVVEEGNLVPADGVIIHSNDFSVNESMLTGESLPVYKDTGKEDHFIYRGTTVASGLAIATLTATGNTTRLGAIGESLESIAEERSPLEIQIRNFVKQMAWAGGIIFLVVWAINFYRDPQLLSSLLKSLTLAMSILPEEIPVAFTSFMALAAWRLMKKGIIVKQMKTVETLGSATVICTDKTGTITENKMALAAVYALKAARIQMQVDEANAEELALIRIAMWASEPIPFDPMEVALHEAYAKATLTDERADYRMAHEYPLEGKPPMMTHIFENAAGQRIIAAKGAPEALIAVSALNDADKNQIYEAINQLAKQGYRVLGVGAAACADDNFPKRQQDILFSFKGIVAFYDPPKENIRTVLQDFYRAGLSVKVLTGDNAVTTKAIAASIGLKGYEQSKSGEALMALNDRELEQCVKDTQVFTRMFPEAKLRIINALKRNGEIVAMTGDGINDGPALKAAHIGIAMGKKGTEIARQAASLILLEDDLSGMLDAVAMGRRIYTNLKKAIRYIISIHVPIILAVFIPLALGWTYPNILSPVHIIFLELIMGPTCSVIYENEPMEPNTMQQKPRPLQQTFFNYRELATSVLQGLAITMAVLLTYQYGVHQRYNEAITRTFVFMTLIVANVVLTLVNRSFYYSVFTTLRYKNNLVVLITAITLLLAAIIIYIPVLRNFFGLALLSLKDTLLVLCTGSVSVLWFEAVKWYKRRKADQR